MHRIFQSFIDHLLSARNPEALREAMAEAIAALDLPCFAYLSIPGELGAQPRLISTYPASWTEHYLERHYERCDPVIERVINHTEPFEWGIGVASFTASNLRQELFDEASRFGIRCGFTIPIHDGRGPTAAVTFASDERRPQFERIIGEHARVLQLMAMYFHSHARRKLAPERQINGISLSPREFECLEWASQGKSAWEIGHILGISRRTAAFHLDNAKAKLRVHSICQAVACLVASRSTT
ncbi:LuxR family transcriptional regulator [Bradyrhizobium sp. SSUT18]|uniref:helix-turn-helix transcriptional regulator n=1 Tax=Bradyrhizobium sp. SSUT18 TaxID=3040602 RepID=UPI002449C3F5|nr:LuxR family transcriptional regulator [Bradyrhizobium sp. SSUT18]MDH2398395.1 LuxR family transcriptional regulator [Bradyrhizobium sp. SSUT18]